MRADALMYRDERELLRDEVMQLRREVERSKSDQERLVQLEKMLDAANRELASLRGTMGMPRRRAGSNATVIAIGVMVFFAGLGGAFLLMARRPTPPPATTPQPDPIATATAEPVAPTPTPEPPETTTTTVPPVAPTAAKPTKSAHATWHATVTKSQGIALAAGTPCTVEANVSDDASGMGADDVVVTCGGKKLYDSNDELEGMSNEGSDGKQYAGEKPGTWTYALVYTDVGTRGPSKNQIAVDSTKRIGKIWSDNLPDFRVDFSIPTKSDPVTIEVATP